MNISRRVFTTLAALALACSFSGCAGQAQSSDSSGASSSSDSGAAEANSKEAVLHVSALGAACSFDSLRDDSDLIAEGRYLGKSDPILVIPVVGGIDAAMYYTDYYFEVDNVFKGEALTDDAASRGSSRHLRSHEGWRWRQGGCRER